MTVDYAALVQEADHKRALSDKTRIDLLKAVEALTRKIFSESDVYAPCREVLGSGEAEVAKVLKAALDQQWTGIEEYSETFYKVLDVGIARQQLQRHFVRAALDTLDHGFDAFDTALIYHGTLVGEAYDSWYIDWTKAVQGNELSRRLEAQDKEGAVPPELYNHYTIIMDAPEGGYGQVAYATYFPKQIGEIVKRFDAWLAVLEKTEAASTEVKEQYISYLRQYRECLAETDVAKLEDAWRVLDERWMPIKHWIQVVHDIEYGYGDPLRCKVAPEFSVRLMDESYAKENATIQEIQGIMVDYFKQRSGQLAKDGLTALSRSMAAIYYLPYQCAAPLFFRFSGQSIPNRSEVRDEYGVKIYFDPVSTAAREVFARDLAHRVSADPAKKEAIDTIDTIVYHVASHEIGHAIYGLDHVKDVIKVSTKTMLEEPRAELTALHTLLLLQKAGMIEERQLQTYTASFMLQDLRRYAMWDSQATRPYTVSAISCWRRAVELRYISLTADGKVSFDDSKAVAFLQQSSALFERLLDAEDAMDGAAIQGVLDEMEEAEKSSIVQHLTEELFHSERRAAAATA